MKWEVTRLWLMLVWKCRMKSKFERNRWQCSESWRNAYGATHKQIKVDLLLCAVRLRTRTKCFGKND